ncbi:MAG: fumarate hydratase [Gammaproteobacteria bacterium]|nr:fumarate hydratase [Gammaproteobacteria bacterium]MCY4217752.1 fumarate hydratase [Gammaproteobacteria bacterium]MCY4275253.1 fumarate hydratase [Gammaproteobacteria bacterium]
MTVIAENDLIESVASALQYISYYHSRDFIQAMHRAWLHEESESAKSAISQILVNSRMSAEGKRPICQDTGIVVIFVKVGMSVQWKSDQSLNKMINEGVRKAYLDSSNPLRASIVSPPIGERKNTLDNTPAVIHVEMVEGDTVDITVSAKGGGSENKSRFAILNPSDDLVDWVLKTVPGMGAGWCPPGVLGIGIGGSSEKAMLLAKESLMEPINIDKLTERGPQNYAEELRLEIYKKVNRLGIGAQGLGGVTTVLDVKIREYPTHAASLPIAMIPNCAATRHAHFTLDGSGPAFLDPPKLSDWPEITLKTSDQTLSVNLDSLTREEIRSWKPGQTLLLSGKLLTGRDAAHKRIAEYYEQGRSLPNGLDFTGRFIYYVGPVDAVGEEAVGPAGPTTATRMDKFTDMMLEKAGVFGMIGKAERGPNTVEKLSQYGSVYLIAVGGAAYLVSKAIKSSRILAFEDLGMEAIHEFEVEEMPVTVAVDSRGEAVHKTGPEIWAKRMSQRVETPSL